MTRSTVAGEAVCAPRGGSSPTPSGAPHRVGFGVNHDSGLDGPVSGRRPRGTAASTSPSPAQRPSPAAPRWRRPVPRRGLSAAQIAHTKRAARYQAAYDAIAASHSGRPLEECVYALGHAWVAVEGTPLKDPDLTHLARRVRLRLRTVLR